MCTKPITGNSIRLVSKNESRTGEQYTAGLALCDLRVFTTAKEINWFGTWGVNISGVRDFSKNKFPVREGWNELLQNTPLGVGRDRSWFAEGEYDVEDRN